MQPEPNTQIVPPRDGQDDPPTRPHEPPSRPEAEPLILQRWVGRYELIHRINHGGMATVYLGRAKGEAGFEKIVAVKVIHPHLAAEAEFVGMFLDEARIAARIHHPHVVEILDLGERDGVYYMVMEFIEGENLSSLVRALKGEPLPVAVVLQILSDTLEGLGAAHELRDAAGSPYKLVHRDVSPHNILINLDGWAKVADFGIMKAAGKASNTKTGELRGKLAYMSPEQARGDGRVDHRSDLFAVGVIAWELLVGARLFACTTEAATLEKVMACEVPLLGDILGDSRAELDGHPRLRAGIEAFLARSLAREPDSRYANASEMLADLKRLIRLADGLAGEQDDARDYLGQLMHRFFRRRVDYARAALRRTDEHEAVIADPRAWHSDPTMQVQRPPTGSSPTLSGTTPSVSPEASPTGSNPGTPNPVLGAAPGSASHPQLSGVNRVTQWSMLLLLPMLGAGIAIAAMLMFGPSFTRSAERVAPDDPAAEPAEVPETPETKAASGEAPRGAPSTLAATELAPMAHGETPPGTVRWWFSTSPVGARVFIDGELHEDPTPTWVQLPVGEVPVEIRLELAGYEPHVLQAPPIHNDTFTPSLRPLDPAVNKAANKTQKRKLKPGKKADAGSSDPKPDSKKAFVPVPDSLRESGG